MKLLDLHINGFGKFHDCSIQFEDGLNLIPLLGRDERVVRALVGDAPVDHVALVVRVRQEPVHRGQD